MTSLPAFLSVPGILTFLTSSKISPSSLDPRCECPSRLKLMIPRSSASWSPRSSSGLAPATTYNQVLFIAPLAVVKVVLNMPLASRYSDDPYARR